MADVTAIRNAIAAAITAGTGLRADGQAKDQVVPPVAVVLPANPFINYSATMDNTLNLSFVVLLIISDAAPVEKTQRALDTYLGVGSGQAASVADAIEADYNLAGTAHFVSVDSAGAYGRVDYAGQTYFGARLSLTVGAKLWLETAGRTGCTVGPRRFSTRWWQPGSSARTISCAG